MRADFPVDRSPTTATLTFVDLLVEWSLEPSSLGVSLISAAALSIDDEDKNDGAAADPPWVLDASNIEFQSPHLVRLRLFE